MNARLRKRADEEALKAIRAAGPLDQVLKCEYHCLVDATVKAHELRARGQEPVYWMAADAPRCKPRRRPCEVRPQVVCERLEQMLAVIWFLMEARMREPDVRTVLIPRGSIHWIDVIAGLFPDYVFHVYGALGIVSHENILWSPGAFNDNHARYWETCEDVLMVITEWGHISHNWISRVVPRLVLSNIDMAAWTALNAFAPISDHHLRYGVFADPDKASMWIISDMVPMTYEVAGYIESAYYFNNFTRVCQYASDGYSMSQCRCWDCCAMMRICLDYIGGPGAQLASAVRDRCITSTRQAVRSCSLAPDVIGIIATYAGVASSDVELMYGELVKAANASDAMRAQPHSEFPLRQWIDLWRDYDGFLCEMPQKSYPRIDDDRQYIGILALVACSVADQVLMASTPFDKRVIRSIHELYRPHAAIAPPLYALAD